MTLYQLKRKSVRLYPHMPYTFKSSVRHARIGWIASVVYMRCRDESLLLIDKPIGRLQ